MSSECSTREIIVNADDFGLTEGINRGIIYGYQNGIVTRASIMASGSAFNHAISLSKDNPGLPIGIHLTLVAERPVSPTDKIRSLIGSNGLFFKDYKTFLVKYFKHKIKLEEIHIEIEAQMEMLQNRGLRINHIDSHQHLHMLPGIFELVFTAAKKLGIEKIRLLRANGLRLKSMRELALTLMQKACLRKIERKGIKFIPNYWGMSRNSVLKEEALLSFINKIIPGVTEIVCHPGYVDSEYREKYSDWGYCPEEELRALTSEKVKRELNAQNIYLIS